MNKLATTINSYDLFLDYIFPIPKYGAEKKHIKLIKREGGNEISE